MFRVIFHAEKGFSKETIDSINIALGAIPTDPGTALSLCECKFVSAVPDGDETLITLEGEYRNGIAAFLWFYFSDLYIDDPVLKEKDHAISRILTGVVELPT